MKSLRLIDRFEGCYPRDSVKIDGVTAGPDNNSQTKIRITEIGALRPTYDNMTTRHSHHPVITSFQITNIHGASFLKVTRPITTSLCFPSGTRQLTLLLRLQS
jgi:hypothetical protein